MRTSGLLKLLGAVLATLLVGSATAQPNPAPADLVFPTEASELSLFSPLRMGIWKPPGAGPFPALIIVHSCGGLKRQISYWRGEAVKRGYVALVIDSFSSRGSPSCRPVPPVTMARGVKDVLDASAHLRTFAFVDKSKIATIGFSWGAMVGMMAASPSFAAQAAPALAPVAATVALYPACFIAPFGASQGSEYLRSDISTPTLLLLGGQDTETPPSECDSRLAPLKERNAPVEAYTYADATHCWDCSDQHNQRWSPPWAGGRQVVYLYNSKVTDDSADRAFEFLQRRLKP